MSGAEARALFRKFLRVGKGFPNYNIRQYIQRRAKEEFHGSAGEADPAKLSQMWAHAREQLEVAQRQSVVYSLYGRKIKNVLELQELQLKPKPHAA